MTVYGVNVGKVHVVGVMLIGVKSIADRARRNEVVAWDKANVIECRNDDGRLWKRNSCVM